MQIVLVAVSIVACLAVAVFAENPNPPVDPLPITFHPRPEHPIVYVTREDFAEARDRVKQHAWAKKAADALVADADAWATKDLATIDRLIPPPAATYAYGLTGCPICNAKLAGWWGTNGAATLDDPDQVRCVNGHRLPDDTHPDTGGGYVDPMTKKTYYFVGTFRSYAIDQLTTAMNRLAMAYGLTGDVRYAERSAYILDRLAAIYPTDTRGSVDYPSEHVSGRFNRPWYQVARLLVTYVNAYDVLRMGDVLDAPSVTAGLTRRENIEKNLLLDAALYCYKQSVDTPALHNGTADYQRGQMAVSAVLGIPEYMKWAVDGPFGLRNMVENNIDRDGQYYESSSEYAGHARALYLDMAEILKHYRDDEHPEGYDVVKSAKFRAMLTRSAAKLDAGGMLLTLGDDIPRVDRVKLGAATQPIWEHFESERFADLTGDATLLRAGGDLDAARSAAPYKDWLLFHAVDAESNASTTQPGTQASDLVHQRGLAILRDGTPDKARAITLRAGPTLNHGHFDEMGLNVYGEGYQFSYDIGYVFGSTHAYQGLGHHTASHNLVLVDEISQMQSGRTGGSVEQFAALPGISSVRADDPIAYEKEGVTTYARDVMFVNIDDATSYGFDVFRVVGGQKHDYLFHGMGTNISTEGLTLSPPAEGSLAGKDIRWGDLIGPDGDVTTEPNRPNWDPPPQNGLGFMMRPRSATPTDVSAVTWNVADDAHLRLNLLPTLSTTVVLAEAPGLYTDGKHPPATFLFARRSGTDLRSTFAGIIEPFGTSRTVTSIESLPCDGDGVGAGVGLSDNRRDVVIRAFAPSTWRDGKRTISLDAGSARIRFRHNDVERVDLFGGSSLVVDTLKINADAPAYRGTIESIDGLKLHIKGTLPTGDLAKGQTLTIGRSTYSHRSTYAVDSIERAGDGFNVTLSPTTLILGRGHLDVAPPDANTLPNVVPMEYAKSLRRVPSGYLDGKRVRTVDGRAATTIKSVDDLLAARMTVADSSGFRAGDDLVVEDVQVGDDVELPFVISLERTPTGWKQLGNTPAKASE